MIELAFQFVVRPLSLLTQLQGPLAFKGCHPAIG
jgi:hypothetical protein